MNSGGFAVAFSCFSGVKGISHCYGSQWNKMCNGIQWYYKCAFFLQIWWILIGRQELPVCPPRRWHRRRYRRNQKTLSPGKSKPWNTFFFLNVKILVVRSIDLEKILAWGRKNICLSISISTTGTCNTIGFQSGCYTLVVTIEWVLFLTMWGLWVSI